MADCIFCKIVAGQVPADFVYQDDSVVVFLDHRPLFPGHALVVPRTHYETLPDLPPDLLAPVFGVARRVSRAMVEGLKAQGSFVAINNKVSQSVPHLHVHVVPRTKGDGMKGFFWPRQGYRDAQHLQEVQSTLRAAMDSDRNT